MVNAPSANKVAETAPVANAPVAEGGGGIDDSLQVNLYFFKKRINFEK